MKEDFLTKESVLSDKINLGDGLEDEGNGEFPVNVINPKKDFNSQLEENNKVIKERIMTLKLMFDDAHQKTQENQFM